jgi:hypothetical protein
VLDFVFVAGDARRWRPSSEILAAEESYCPDDNGLKKAGRLEQLDPGPVANERTPFRVRIHLPDASALVSDAIGEPLFLDLI